jgi:hypothetical protein
MLVGYFRVPVTDEAVSFALSVALRPAPTASAPASAAPLTAPRAAPFNRSPTTSWAFFNTAFGDLIRTFFAVRLRAPDFLPAFFVVFFVVFFADFFAAFFDRFFVAMPTPFAEI